MKENTNKKLLINKVIKFYYNNIKKFKAKATRYLK